MGRTTGAGTGRLYRNEGHGVFTPITTGQLPELSLNSTGAAWGDYDNDGWLDLIVSNYGTDGKNRLYHNYCDGTFLRVMSGPGGDVGGQRGEFLAVLPERGFVKHLAQRVE